MPACLITGGSGFLGRHLLSSVSGGRFPGSDVVAVGRRPPSDWPIEAFRVVDLDDPDHLALVVADLEPSTVFHLAGRTPPASPADYYRSNTLGTVHLLDALRQSGRACRVVMAGSAAEIGPVPVEALPVAETYPCRPADAYGLSKWLATVAGLSARSPVEVVVARVFNPIGPGLPISQALGRFASLLARGSGPLRLAVGNLEARRDFVDARDVALALLALAESGEPGNLYHVGTGRSQAIGDGLTRLIALSGREVTIEVDQAIARSPGPLDSRADVRRIARDTGWSARISWEQSIHDLWADAIEADGGANLFRRRAVDAEEGTIFP
jgi:nucleoside-diphosphate-sugar epimerase